MDGTVLVADDDRTIRTVLTQALTRAGCKVHATSSLTTLMRWVTEGRGDAVISDVVMPDGNGLEMLPKIAQERPGLPVIVISAQNTIMTAIRATEAEAFDYLPKPFSMAELVVRVEALLRRVSLERHRPALTEAAGGLVLDEASQGASYRHQDLGLTGTEFRLLQVLLEHRDQVLSKPFLYQAVLYRGWGRHDRSLDLHVSHLRRKLRAAGVSESTVRTVWGQGYTLVTAHL